MKEKSGSVTIFAILSIMLIAAVLFTLLEAGRRQELIKIAKIQTESSMESAFAEYIQPLWEEYHLLALELGDENGRFSIEKEMEALANQNLAPVEESQIRFANNLLQMRAIDAEIVGYALLTDEHVFEAAVASYMKNNISVEAAKHLYGQYEAIGQIIGDHLDVDDAITEAVVALENGEIAVDAQDSENEVYKVPEDLPKVEVKENPLEVVKLLKEKGILAIAVPGDLTISTYCNHQKSLVSKRQLQQGSMDYSISSEWMDKIYLEQYLSEYFSCFTKPKDNRAFCYEQEYLIGGSESDEDNLRDVVQKLLAIREGANLLYLATDQVKQKEIEAAAVAIAGVSVNPVIIEIVKWGILAAWAYVESILDIRALLSGESIAPLKNSTEWTSDVTNLASILANSGRAKNCKAGLSYEQYLGILLFSSNTQKVCMRAMDVMEACVCLRSGYAGFQMDQVMIDGQFRFKYAYQTIFMGMDAITTSMKREFYLESYGTYSYRKAGV